MPDRPFIPVLPPIGAVSEEAIKASFLQLWPVLSENYTSKSLASLIADALEGELSDYAVSPLAGRLPNGSPRWTNIQNDLIALCLVLARLVDSEGTGKTDAERLWEVARADLLEFADTLNSKEV